MTLEECQEKLRVATEQLKDERDKHQAKDRAYTAGLKEREEKHAKLQADKDKAHADELDKVRKTQKAELDRKDNEHTKAVMAIKGPDVIAIEETIKAEQAELAAKHKQTILDFQASLAKKG